MEGLLSTGPTPSSFYESGKEIWEMLQQASSEKIFQLSQRNVQGLRKVWVLDKIVFIQ